MYFIVLLGHNQILTLKTLSYANHILPRKPQKILDYFLFTYYNEEVLAIRQVPARVAE